MARWLRLAALTAGALILLPLLAAAAGLAWLQTQPGRDWLEARIAGGSGGQVRAEGLSGSIPFDAQAERLVLSDGAGAWLTAHEVRLSIRPASLLRLHLEIEQLSAARIELLRRPQEEPGEDDDAPASSFDLPVSIELAELSAPEIVITPAAVGHAARLSASGSGVLHQRSGRLQLAFQRLDAPGSANAQLTFDKDGVRLDLSLDDPGGLTARALGAQSDVPVQLRAEGKGTLDSWRGTVEAALAQARSDLTIAVDRGLMTVTGAVDPRPLLQPRIAALLPEPLRVEALARIDEPRTLQRLALASGPARLSFEGAIRLEDLIGSGEAQLVLPDAAVLQPLLGIELSGAVSGTASIETSAEGQSAKLLLEGKALAAEGYEVRSLRLDATAIRPHGAAAVDLNGVLQGSGIASVAQAGRPVLPADLALSFDAAVDPEARSLVARRVVLTGEGAEIGFAGTVMADGLLDGTLRLSVPRLAPFSQLAGLDWTGAVALEAKLSASPGRGSTRFSIDGSWREPRTGIAALDPALGPTVALTAVGSADYDGALEIEQARAVSDAVDLSLLGRLALLGPIDARFEVSAPDLRPLAAGLGRPLAGAARIAGTLTGTAAAPRVQVEATSPSLSVAGTELRDLSVALNVAEVRTTPRGTVSGGAIVKGLRTEFRSTLALEDRLLSIADLRAEAGGSMATGNLAVALETGAVTGTLNLDAPDLAPWSELAKLPLRGSARARIALAPNSSAAIEGTGTELAIADIRIASLRATADLSTWRGPLAGRIDLAADRIETDNLFLERATLRLDPKSGDFPLRFAGTGVAAAPFTLEAQGTYESGAQRLQLRELGGSYAEKPVRLRGPTTLRLSEGLATAPFELAWGGARIAGEFALGQRLSGSLRVSGLPVQDVAALAGRQDVKGTFQGTLALSGTASNPSAKLSSKIAGLAFTGTGEDAPAGDLAFGGELGKDQLTWRAELSSTVADLSVRGSGTLPISWSRPPFGIAVAPAGPMRGEIRGSGQIEPLIALVGVGEDRASGRYVIDLRLAGAMNAPSISGSARVENGTYENFASGAILRDIALRASGAQDRLDLSLTAADGEGGRMEGSGTLRLTGASIAAIDLTTRFDGFRAIRRDDVQARATGALALAGPLDQMLLSGQVRLDRMNINLPERSRVSAPVLDVLEVNAPEEGAERVTRTAPAERDAPAAFEIALDLRADLPHVDVQGRGLRSEWHGDIHVGGTTVAPQLTGELRLDRGTFAALGKTFTLTEGLITFPTGPELDPSIRVIAEKEVRDAVVRVTLTGSLSSPLLDFSARPELPVDEVLARLLFDKGAGEVGAAEALQLAQVAAALQGGGTSTGVMEQIGQKLGLDRVDISTVETVNKETGKAGEAAALSLGKNLSEDVRVGVEQGIDPGTGSVTVEVDLGKNLSVESRVGAQGRSGVGLKWEYDY
jgi:translocation and assembly module TamB